MAPELAELQGREKAISAEIEAVAKDIDGCLRTLAALDKQQFPQTLIHRHIAPASLGGGQRAAVNVRGEFFDDLWALKERMSLLQAQLNALRRKHPRLLHRVLLQDALAKQAAFRSRTQRELVRQAKKGGDVDARTLEKLERESEFVLHQFIVVLKADPSRRNIERVLDAMKDPMLLGAQTRAGALNDAFLALRSTGLARVRAAHRAYELQPTQENLRELLRRIEEGQFLGLPSDQLAPYVPDTGKKHDRPHDRTPGK
jgi:hypothetical protein